MNIFFYAILRSSTRWLTVATIFLATSVARGQVNHGGADWITGTETVSGHHYNIGRFVVPGGTTLSVLEKLVVECVAAKVDGAIYGNGLGYGGGGGGGGGGGADQTSGGDPGDGGGGGTGVRGAANGNPGGRGGDTVGGPSGAGSDGYGPGGYGGGAGSRRSGSGVAGNPGGNAASDGSLRIGGGGGGGSGGSGGHSSNSDAGGGGGGGGANGGSGGAMIEIYASKTLDVTGHIYTLGLPGAQGGSGFRGSDHTAAGQSSPGGNGGRGGRFDGVTDTLKLSGIGGAVGQGGKDTRANPDRPAGDGGAGGGGGTGAGGGVILTAPVIDFAGDVHVLGGSGGINAGAVLFTYGPNGISAPAPIGDVRPEWVYYRTKLDWPGGVKLPTPVVTIVKDIVTIVNPDASYPGIQVRYTLDGSEPNNSSFSYGGPFSVKSGVCVRAIAFVPRGWEPSEPSAPVCANYQLATPKVIRSPEPHLQSDYTNSPVIVTAQDTSGQAAILRYTVDCTAPTIASPVFPVGGLKFETNGNIRVAAFKDTWAPSTPSDCVPVVFRTLPVTADKTNKYSAPTAFELKVQSPTEGDVLIRYQFNNGPIQTVTNGGTVKIPYTLELKLSGTKAGWLASSETSFSFTVGGGDITFDPPTGHWSNRLYSVQMNVAVALNAIKYTTDNSDPRTNVNALVTTNGSRVFIVRSPTTIRAVAFDPSAPTITYGPEGSAGYQNMGEKAKVGEQIVAPVLDMTWTRRAPLIEEILVDPPSVNTNRWTYRHATFVPDDKKVFALVEGQGSRIGWWHESIKNYVEFEHDIEKPDDEKVVNFFHTEEQSGVVQESLLVDLKVRHPKIHFGPDVQGISPGRAVSPADAAFISPTLWIDTTRNVLRSKGPYGGVAVVELRDGPSSGFIGMQVVRVKSYYEEVERAPGSVSLGDRLMPRSSRPDETKPRVARGRGPKGDAGRFIYQHDAPGEVTDGWSFAVKRSERPVEMELVWFQSDRFPETEIEWPFEVRRYTAAWPAKPQLYVRGRFPDPIGPHVVIPAALNPDLESFVEPLSSNPPRLTNNIFSADGEFRCLIRYQTRDRANRDWVGFSVVQSVLHDDSRVYSGVKATDIGREITDTNYHRGQLPAYVHVPSSRQWQGQPADRYDPDIYGTYGTRYEGLEGTSTGQVFPVNVGTMELWWSSVHEDKDWKPGLMVQWPSKVSRHVCKWPAQPLVIELARQSIAYTYWTNDPISAFSLTKIVSRTNDPIALHLWTNIPPSQRYIITNKDPKVTPESKLVAVSSGINGVLQKGSIYDETRFQGVTLSEISKAGIGRKLVGLDILRLNRSLLEDAYESILGRSVFAASFDALVDSATHYKSKVYFNNDPGEPGYNPNEEHAWIGPGAIGDQVYALRDDLNITNSTSEPYVLHAYRIAGRTNAPWDFRVFAVKTGDLVYPGVAGVPIQPPMPLSMDPPLPESYGVSGPYWKDRKLGFWAKAAGDDGLSSAPVIMRYFYRAMMDENYGFWFPDGEKVEDGTPVPWLDREAVRLKQPDAQLGQPINVRYDIRWPERVPILNWGETLYAAKRALPEVNDQKSTDVLYEQPAPGAAEERWRLVRLIDPIRSYKMPLANNLLTDVNKLIPKPGIVYFADLPPHLQTRIWYDTEQNAIHFSGQFIKPTSGADFLLLNVLDSRDKAALLNITKRADLKAKLESFAAMASSVIFIESQDKTFESQALTAGYARGAGYVTLAFGNNVNRNSDSDPVSVEIIRVDQPLFRGEIAVMKPVTPFDEKLTLRHIGDFGGRADEFEFEWRWYSSTIDDSFKKDPFKWAEGQAGKDFSPNEDYSRWKLYPKNPIDREKSSYEPMSGSGAREITVEGANLFTLGDTWFVCRYRPLNPSHPFVNKGWSAWTEPQLAEGWIKRVVKGINEFSLGLPTVTTESQFRSYAKSTNNAISSMISLAGKRWEGNIAFNLEKLGDNGLIQIYETVLRRGRELSIQSNPPQNYDPANTSLLLVASRIASLHALLGNEAYADASDPTLAFGVQGEKVEIGIQSTSLHSFMNQVPSLLEEELALLRGQDLSGKRPYYNRLPWNFTLGAGRAAYELNYGIRDSNQDGKVDEADAAISYPQGHGDAWGHYLTALSTYYGLLSNTNFVWVPRSESILVGGQPVEVDFQDERQFANIAVAKARTGAEIVTLTYRKRYTEEPEGQWQGYSDERPERAWGVGEWAQRTGQGSYIDWVVGNAILPDVDRNENHTQDIQKVDRTRVRELDEISNIYRDIEAKMDEVDRGLNPLGLARNIVPFDISAEAMTGTSPRTHFEQVYDRAVDALNVAITGFDIANSSAQKIRQQADTLKDFQNSVQDREADLRSRLIEIFGYPYEDDVPAKGGIYTDDYVKTGPDLYHYMYVDPTPLLGNRDYSEKEFTVDMLRSELIKLAGDNSAIRSIPFTMSTEGFGLVKPKRWVRGRRAPGEIQSTHSDLLQAYARFARVSKDYDNLLDQVSDQRNIVAKQASLNGMQLASLGMEVSYLRNGLSKQISLNEAIASARAKQVSLQNKAAWARWAGEAAAEFIPTVVGLFDNDPMSTVRGALKMTASTLAQVWSAESSELGLKELDSQQSKEVAQGLTSIEVRLSQRGVIQAQGDLALKTAKGQLAQLWRSEASMRLEMYSLLEAMDQAAGRYAATLSRGIRLVEEVERFRQQTAEKVQDFRVKDMTYRIFRNDGIQKFRAQFDLAARYTYLAAIAYDYETGLLRSDRNTGQRFLTDIVKRRAIGAVANGRPQSGNQSGDPGLADSLARLWTDWSGVKPGFGLGSITKLQDRSFSLRRELFRNQTNAFLSTSKQNWLEILKASRVRDLSQVPEYVRFCTPLPGNKAEPAIVMRFGSVVQPDQNFFGWPKGGADQSYPATHFAVKIMGVGVGFENYDSARLPMNPTVYFFPVGQDIMRSPTDGESIRAWRVFDQAIPLPYNVGRADMISRKDYIPAVDSVREVMAASRTFAEMDAYHDGRAFDLQRSFDNRLIGRSVWNTEWILIIPGRSFDGSDPEAGLDQFILGRKGADGVPTGNGVTDIRIRFEAYSHPGTR